MTAANNASLLCCSADLCSDIVNEAASGSILHHKIEDVVGEVHVQQANDAGVLQARQHADLILDLINLGNAAEVAGINRLDCNRLPCTGTDHLLHPLAH